MIVQLYGKGLYSYGIVTDTINVIPIDKAILSVEIELFDLKVIREKKHWSEICKYIRSIKVSQPI